MSRRAKGKLGGVVYSLEDYVKPTEDITVTKISNPQNDTADVVVEKDSCVDVVIETPEVDNGHMKVGDDVSETGKTNAGDGRLDINAIVEAIEERHAKQAECHKTTIDAAISTEITTVCSTDDTKTMEISTITAKADMSSKEMTVVNKKDACPEHGGLPEPATGRRRKGKCTCGTRAVHRIQKRVTAFMSHNSRYIGTGFRVFFLICYYAMFGYAMYYKFGDDGSIRLLTFTCLLTLFVFYRIVRMAIKKKWKCCCCFIHLYSAVRRSESVFWRLVKAMKLKAILCVMMFLAFLVYTIVIIGLNQPRNLISAGGMLAYIILFFIFSDNPEKVRWRPVFCGLAMQFVFAMLLMRCESGASVFLYVGDRITSFMEYADDGAKFVFGPNFADHFFAFKVMPVIIFFSSIISVLYHLGIMQFVIKHIGRLLTLILDTSPAENVVAVANIFLGQTEAPLLAGPYLEKMTRSELHTVMASGFATVAGPIMAAFTLYKVPVVHLLSASVMSAPAAIGMSKLFYPETEEPTKVTDNFIYKVKGRATNVLEAASNGAIESVKIVANILVHLIAFLSILMMMNAALTFLGYRVGLIPPEYPELTFQLVYSYLFWPAAYMMGTDFSDCGRVAEMIGTKLVINEFAAYATLSEFIYNKNTLLSYLGDRNLTMATANMTDYFYSGNDIILADTQQTLIGGIISDRSTVISTYALCGFSNASAIGVMLGLLVALIPSRKSDISRVVFRAMVAGNVASFMTACMAGLLYKD